MSHVWSFLFESSARHMRRRSPEIPSWRDLMRHSACLNIFETWATIICEHLQLSIWVICPKRVWDSAKAPPSRRHAGNGHLGTHHFTVFNMILCHRDVQVTFQKLSLGLRAMTWPKPKALIYFPENGNAASLKIHCLAWTGGKAKTSRGPSWPSRRRSWRQKLQPNCA